MILHQDKKKKKVKRIISFIVIVVFAYVLFASPLSSSIAGCFHRVAAPVWKVGLKVDEKISPFFSYFSSRRTLYVENKELKARSDAMEAKLADRNFLRRENIILKEKLGRSEEDPERITAFVLAKPDMTPYDTLIIDVGKKDGIVADDLVVVENVVIGSVAEVYRTSSKVRLYSSHGQRVTVFIGNSATLAEAIGLGGGNFEIELPQNVDVLVGDPIYIPEFQPQILGTVEHINADPNDAFEKIMFKSPVSIFSLRFVDIIHSPHE